MARISWENIDRAVNQFGKNTVKRAKGNLSREKGKASGRLYNSIRYRFKDRVLIFTMEPYGAFMDQGVTGTGKLFLKGGRVRPVAYNKSDARPEYKFKRKVIGGQSSIRKWIRLKNVPVSDFVIRRSIAARGIRPRRFFSEAFNYEADKFEEELEKVITLDVEENLDEILKQLKN
jgi:hypothetical protein